MVDNQDRRAGLPGDLGSTRFDEGRHVLTRIFVIAGDVPRQGVQHDQDASLSGVSPLKFLDIGDDGRQARRAALAAIQGAQLGKSSKSGARRTVFARDGHHAPPQAPVALQAAIQHQRRLDRPPRHLPSRGNCVAPVIGDMGLADAARSKQDRQIAGLDDTLDQGICGSVESNVDVKLKLHVFVVKVKFSR